VRAADRIGAVLLLVTGLAWSVTAARRYPYWGASGPDSGFFPFWSGVILAALAALLLSRAARDRHPGPSWLPTGHGAARVGVVVVATAVFIGVMPVVGMTLGTALFMAVLLRGLEGHSWAATLGVSVGVAAANWAVFTWWLRVPFPLGVLGF
jgi:putative tricarboxylic transport membrane protein